jgi:hypothetical protein
MWSFQIVITLPTVVFLDCADTAHCGLSVLLVAGSWISALAYSKGKDDRQTEQCPRDPLQGCDCMHRNTYWTDHACHQKSTPSRETVPLSYSYEIGYLFWISSFSIDLEGNFLTSYLWLWKILANALNFKLILTDLDMGLHRPITDSWFWGRAWVSLAFLQI